MLGRLGWSCGRNINGRLRLRIGRLFCLRAAGLGCRKGRRFTSSVGGLSLSQSGSSCGPVSSTETRWYTMSANRVPMSVHPGRWPEDQRWVRKRLRFFSSLLLRSPLKLHLPPSYRGISTVRGGLPFGIPAISFVW